MNGVLGLIHFEVPVCAGSPSVEFVVRVGQLGVGRREIIDDLLVREEIRAVTEAKLSFWRDIRQSGWGQEGRPT